MINHDPIVIVGLARTPQGAFQGELAGFTAAELGTRAIKAAIERSGLKTDDVEDVIMGCVLPAGQGQAPARQASLGAGLPQATGATTINKMCGSGLKAVMMAHDNILAGSAGIMVAGGMESMTNAPYLLPKARGGFRMGHGQVMDHMFLDGLEDAYDRGKLMGCFADDTARNLQITREEQDKFALESLSRAQNATKTGAFSAEIVPIKIKTKEGEVTIAEDESPKKARTEKITQLKPETGIQPRRDGDGGQREFHFRRCCGGRADAQIRGGKTETQNSGNDTGPCNPCAKTGGIYIGPHRRNGESPEKSGLERQGRRSFRDQRGVCGGDARSHQGPEPAA